MVLAGLISATVSYGQHDYAFSTLTFREGLSHSNVNSIVQDSTGYLWLGTENGLNRYDGTEIVVFKHIIGDTTSLPDNDVRQLFVDSQHRLWVITESGVCRYRPTSRDFRVYSFDILLNTQASNPMDIVETATGQLWVLAHHRNTIAVFSEKHDRFEKHVSVDTEATAQALCVYQDRVFLGAQKLLLEINPATGNILRSDTLHDESPSLSSGITQLTAVGDRLWIAGAGIYLHCFDPATREMKRINHLSEATSLAPLTESILLTTSKEGVFLYHTVTGQTSPLSLVDYQDFLDDVMDIFIDQDGNLWMSSRQKGVIYSTGQRVFRDIRHLTTGLQPYANKISSLQVVDDRQLWVGLDNGRLAILDLETGQHRWPGNDAEAKTLPGKGTVFSILEDRQSQVWVGSYEGGLRQYDTVSDSFVRHKAQLDSLQIRSNDIRSIAEDQRGNLWLATHGRGIDVYDPEQRRVVASHGLSVGDTDPFIGDWTFQLAIAPDNSVWVGSASGLQMIKGTTKKFFQHRPDQPGSLSNDHVTCLFFDTRGHLWIGTAAGLNVLNVQDSSFTKFTTQQGLSDNYVSSLIEDDEGYLWVGTHDGLSRLSYATMPQEASVRNVELPSGLYSNQFVDQASTIDSAGNLYFATTHGILTFNPKELPAQKSELEVFFTDLEVFNSSLERQESTLLAGSLNSRTTDERHRIRLAPHENTMTVSFSAIDFVHSGQLRYHYQLAGYNNQWSVSTDRSVTYHDLPPGEYEFLVRASVANALSPVKSLSILIRSPWYNTVGGRVAIALVLMALVMLVVYVLLERIRLRNQARLNDKEQEVNQLKVKFFTNISHEFRTPLTLILGPLRDLIRLVDDHEVQWYLRLIQHNTQRLSRLANQLLDMRRLEQQRYPLNVAEGEIVVFVHGIYDSFRYLAEQHDIDYRFNNNLREPEQRWFDADVLDKILYNLLDNAFKHTPRHGRVEISVSDHPTRAGWTTVEVSDTGTGISAEQLGKIFDRFYRVEGANSQAGSGVGLALCQDLARLHQGQVTATSAPQLGSTFILAIPTQASNYAFGEKADRSLQQGEEHDLGGTDRILDTIQWDTTPITVSLPQNNEADSRPIVLIVDDNIGLLQFVQKSVSQNFRVIVAENGQEAFRQAVATVPDAVVSDVMMPVMDGMQLVEQLKKDIRTSHIPVVLLTARVSEQHQVAGLQLGVDDYIPKPFSVEVLTAKLQSLIANRAKLKEVFATNSDWTKVETQVGRGIEKTFLSKLTNIVDKNMDNTSFGTDDLCEAIGMSRSQLYRKLSAVTGKSVHEFVKLYRLSRAAELLRSDDYTIAEVASMTGFKYAQSFTRSFKEHHDCTPSQYVKRSVQRV